MSTSDVKIILNHEVVHGNFRLLFRLTFTQGNSLSRLGSCDLLVFHMSSQLGPKYLFL